jgi:mannose-6-phosphate isomerase-like protein (cupin superfamily)
VAICRPSTRAATFGPFTPFPHDNPVYYVRRVRGKSGTKKERKHGGQLMDHTPAPVTLAFPRALQPPEGSRTAEVFRDDHVWIRFAARPTSGPQVPHHRDEFYIVASGTARYRWGGGETMIRPGDMMFAAAHTPHGYDQFSEGFSVWVVFYGPQR